jgi:hypothetical protein
MKVYLYVLGISLLLIACNKVQDHYNLVDSQPWISGGTYSIGPNEGPPSYTYPTTVYIGDTMSMFGKMFIGAGGILKIGGVTPAFVYTYKGPDSVDLVRFIITKGMGIGNNIPVTLSVPWNTIQGPSINIRQIAGGLGRTDTTLVAEQIASWTPSNYATYTNNNIPLIIGTSVSGNGVVYFSNPLGVFAVTGGSVQPIIQAGNRLSDNNGSFTVGKVMGSCISNDGNTLAFSVQVSDNADTLSNYVFRLCTMDMGSGTITTLNRTLEPMATLSQGNTGSFSGPVAQIKMVATSIKADINGNWYFTNCYAVPSPGIDMGLWDSTVTDNPGIFTAARNELDNICELGTSGKVQSILSIQSGGSYSKGFSAPGIAIADMNNTAISLDGTTAFVHNVFNSTNSFFNEGAVNLNLQTTLAAPPVDAIYKYISYDTSSVTGWPSQIVQFINFQNSYAGSPPMTLALPNGYVLYDLGAPSLFAFNVLNETMYIYAGTEIGLVNGTPAAQDQTAGPAKWVNFAMNGNFTYFNGVDNKGAVYYFTTPGGSNGYGSPTTGGAPLTFYKLYSSR